MAVKRITPVNYAELYDYDPAATTAGDKMEVTVEKCNNRSDSISQIRIDEMNLPSRLKNSLQKNNIFIVGDLTNYSSAKLRKMHGIDDLMLRVLVTELEKKEYKQRFYEVERQDGTGFDKGESLEADIYV